MACIKIKGFPFQTLMGLKVKVSLFDDKLSFVLTLGHLYTNDIMMGFVQYEKQTGQLAHGKVPSVVTALVWKYSLTVVSVSVSPLWLKISMTFTLCRTLQWQQSQSWFWCCALIMHQRLRGQ